MTQVTGHVVVLLACRILHEIVLISSLEFIFKFENDYFFLQLSALLNVRMVLVLQPIIVVVLWDSLVKHVTLLSCQSVTSILVKMAEPALLLLALTFVTVHLSLLESTA